MATLASRHSVGQVTALSLAVLAANVAVLSTGPVAANMRLSEIAPKDSVFWYSIMAAAGALFSAVGYLAFGRISDFLFVRRGTRRLIFAVSAAILAVGGVLLTSATQIFEVLIAWILIQVSASAILSAGTTVVLEGLSKRAIGFASGLFGAAAIFAVIYGQLINGLGLKPQGVLVIGFATAVILAIPAALVKERTTPAAAEKTALPKLKFTGPLLRFLFGVFAVQSAIALSSDYYYQVALQLTGSKVEARDVASLLLTVASLGFLVAALVGGWVATKVVAATRMFALTLLVAAVGVLLIGFGQSLELILSGAVVVGVAGGANVGSQFQTLKTAVGDSELIGNEVGLYNVVTVLPTFVVPALVALIYLITKTAWTEAIAVIVSLLALFAGALARINRIR